MTWDDLRAEAFGEIGLLPEHFYQMERDDYWLLHRGFFNKRIYDQRVFRNGIMLLISPWVKNPPSPYQLWPLPEDDKLQEQASIFKREIRISEASRERLRKLREQNNKA